MNVRWLPPLPDPDEDDASDEVRTERRPTVMRALPIDAGGRARCASCGRFVASNEELCDRCASEADATDAADRRPVEAAAARAQRDASGAASDHAFAMEVAWVFDRTRSEFVIPRPSELHTIEHAPVIRNASHLPAPPPVADRVPREETLPAPRAVGVQPVIAEDRAADVGPADGWIYHPPRELTRVGIVPTSHDDEPSLLSQVVSAATEPRWLARIVILLAVLLSLVIPLLLLR